MSAEGNQDDDFTRIEHESEDFGFIQRMPEDATIDDAIDRLNLLKAVAAGLSDVEAGRVREHDDD